MDVQYGQIDLFKLNSSSLQNYVKKLKLPNLF